MLTPVIILSGEFLSDYTELAPGVSLITVAVRITGNPNETALGVVVGSGEGPPTVTAHRFYPAGASPSNPFRDSFSFLATEAFVGIDAGDGFVGDVVVYSAPAE